MNGKAPEPLHLRAARSDTARVRKFAEEKVPDDDDIIAAMVMVSLPILDQRDASQNFPI